MSDLPGRGVAGCRRVCALLRQQVGVVLEHHHTFQLLLISTLHELRVAHNLFRVLHIDIRVFKQSGAEDVEQQAACRAFETRPHPFLAMLLHAHLVSLDYGTFLVVAAELVYASHQGFIVAFGHAHCLHTPRLAGMDAWVLLVAGYDPVGADHAVVASLLTQLM